MATNGGVAVTHPHAPAWKHLGLKLKYASDLPVGTGQKRKLAEGEDEEGEGEGDGDDAGSDGDGAVSEESKKEKRRHKKKRKEMKSESSAEEEEDKENGKVEKEKKEKTKSKKTKGKDRKYSDADTDMELKGDEDASSTPPPAPLSPPDSTSTANNISPSKSSLRKRSVEEKRALRKSVTFTADTKATDGDSIKTLYQNYDPFAHYDSYQQHINNYPTNELPEGFDDEPVTEQKHKKFADADNGEPISAKKQKKERKAKKQKKDSDGGVSVENVKPQLSYLLTYYTSRETWKFEKSKQNWILRNAFDPVSIPQEGYADALKSYITGIQGAAARDRLLAEANEIVKHGKDTISRDGEKLNVEDQKASVTRAKLILAALGHCDDDEEEEEGSDSSNSDEEE